MVCAPPLQFGMLWSEVAVLSKHRGCNWRVVRLPLWPGKHRIRRIVSHYILQVVFISMILWTCDTSYSVPFGGMVIVR